MATGTERASQRAVGSTSSATFSSESAPDWSELLYMQSAEPTAGLLRHSISAAEYSAESAAHSNQFPHVALAEPTLGFQWLSSTLIPFYQLRSSAYRLAEPIWIQIQTYSGGYLVTDQEVNRHGVGSIIEEALQDYEETLVGYYESLVSRRDRLSPRLRRHLHYLARTLLPA